MVFMLWKIMCVSGKFACVYDRARKYFPHTNTPDRSVYSHSAHHVRAHSDREKERKRGKTADRACEDMWVDDYMWRKKSRYVGFVLLSLYHVSHICQSRFFSDVTVKRLACSLYHETKVRFTHSFHRSISLFQWMPNVFPRG